MTGKVGFETMDTVQCEALLDRNWLGRVAYAEHSKVDIEPLGYVRSGKWLFGRTSHGTKLNVVGHQPWVAFEVDEVKGPYDWKCVIVHGSFYRLSDHGSAFDRETYARALAALAGAAPDTLTSHDPVPHRTVVFGIHIDSMSGRSARLG
jgi:nitroimidazol reductase NimA-like FMN-containing flavoprotein (pyridoxamine 5'-phosphate oxidase superfamily)